MVRQSNDNCGATSQYVYTIFKKFHSVLSCSSFFCPSPPLSISFGAGLVSIHVYGSSKVSGSVALWTCPCFVPTLVCLPLGPCVPSGSTFLVLVPWSPGCSIIPTRMFNGSGLMPLPA